jgi:O-antigen/teichoic acid export membrane protein
MFTAIDRFFLTNLLGLEQTGNYSVAFQLGAVFSLLTVAFNNAYVPWLFKNLNLNSIIIKIKIVKFTYLYFILLCVSGLILILIFPLISSIFIGSAFISVNIYSTFIIFGLVFQGMYFMVTNYIIYANKTHLQAALTITVGLIKIPVTYFSIKWFGPVGASVSYCVTFFLFFIFTWIISAKVYSMPWMLYKISK